MGHAFRGAYADLDVSRFLSVHSPDLIHAGGPDARVLGFAEYAALTPRGVFRITTARGVLYGRFHTFSRRAERWRIVADYDSAGADAEAFAGAVGVDDLSAFTG